MSRTFDDSEVLGWEPLVTGLELPDKDDRHVLAAAIAGHAPLIVTFNLSDFPAKHLNLYSVEAIHPGEFLLDLLDLAPQVVVRALVEQVSRYQRPRMELGDLLDRLDRAGVAAFCDEVRRLTL